MFTEAMKIQEALKRESRSIRWTANQAGMSPPTLWRKLHGQSDFTLTEILNIAKALKVSPASLLPDEFNSGVAA